MVPPPSPRILTRLRAFFQIDATSPLLQSLVRAAIPFLLLAGVLALLVIRVVPTFPVISDFADYDTIAQSLAVSGTYIALGPLIYPPLYPAFLALIYIVFGHTYTFVFIAQYLLMGCTGTCVYVLLRRHGGVRAVLAALGGIAVILWPYFILYSYLISNEVLYTFFLVAGTLALFEALAHPSSRRFAAVGALWGLAALTRPVILLLPVWLAFGSFVLSFFNFDRGTWAVSKRYLTAAGIAYILVIAPWIAFTYGAFGRLVPIASNFSAVWDKGNETLAYLSDAPPQAHGLRDVAVAKLQNVFLVWDPGASGYQMEGLVQAIPAARYAIFLYRILFFLILALAAASLLTRATFPWILWAVIGYTWALHTVLFPFPRYTLPIIPLVIAAAVYLVDYCLSRAIVSRTKGSV